nr:immunoglobulin light chain junction region [Macaca mulatta]MOX12277.1 immunoglobulin light chain junction region [Macaca mulatta]MOX14033.1 immunoglobulin light chain junction region [Macaca mulatta]
DYYCQVWIGSSDHQFF